MFCVVLDPPVVWEWLKVLKVFEAAQKLTVSNKNFMEHVSDSNSELCSSLSRASGYGYDLAQRFGFFTGTFP